MKYSLLAIPLLISSGLQAQAPTADGDQFQVNTYVGGQQVQPAVASDPVGNYVVVWVSSGSSGTDTSNQSVQGQRFNASGAPIGGEFQVNTYTTSIQGPADVAVDGSGNFVVVWESNGSAGTDTSEESIHAQRFDSDGNPVGSEFQVNTYTLDEQSSPVVAMDSLGNFVVVWESYGSDGTDDDYNSIQGQLYDVDGDPVGGEFQVNTYTTGRQEDVAVTADGLGNFIVVWESDLTDMKGQLYDVSGAAVGGEFKINTTGSGSLPDVSANSAGDFTVVWQGEDAGGVDTSRTSIEVQLFDSGGNPVGDQFQVNTYTTEWQRDPAVAMDSAGNFIIVWESDGSFGTDTSEESIQAQYFASGGSPEGGEFQINTLTANEQGNPALATGPSGGIFVVWDSYKNSAGNDSSYRSIQGQRYSAGAEVVFGDGFESGDTSGWTSTTQ